jgi:ABC-type glycerol-3-phosphate transport system permease component
MKSGPADVARLSIVGLLGLLWLVPVYLLLSNASKSIDEYSQARIWLPGNPADLVDNIGTIFTRTSIPEALASTALYAVVSPLFAIVIGAGVGFAVIVLRVRHAFAWFFVVFCGTVFPLQMMVIPLFDAYSRLNLFDTYGGMILVYSAISVPFCAFVMRNFFTGIAESVFEAAVVDGASVWRIFTRIYLPMSAPALAVLFILQATWIWNDLLLGLILTRSDETRPVMTALSALTVPGLSSGASETVVLTASLIVSVPTFVLFMAFQRMFSKGLALGQY